MRKGERKKQDILAAAAALFAQKGYAGTSIQDILDALACSKGSFYHHFKAKFDVLAALAEQRAALALERFLDEQPPEPWQALNKIFHEAGFLNQESLPLLMDLLALGNTHEGGALLYTMQEAARKAFRRPFIDALDELRKEDKAIFSNAFTPDIAFQSFQAGCALIIFSALDKASGADDRGAGLLRALRSHLEAILGLSPGTVLILEQDELGRILKALRGGR